MAQTGFTPIQLYSTTTAAAAPVAGNLAQGELAINVTDGKLFYKDNLSAVQTIAYKNVPISTVAGLGTGVATALAVNVGTAGSPVVNGGALGTPSGGTLTNATGLPVSSGISGLGTGVATALAVNVGTAGAPVVNGGVLGTPSSGTVTNLTGTASININGTVGATTANTGAFTTLAASGAVTLSGGTANGVTYLDGSKVLTSGSALTFDGAILGVNSVSVGRGAGAVATNTAVGGIALGANTSGIQNAAFGYLAATTNTTGGANTALGVVALTTNSTGSNNSAIGAFALYNNTTASNNTAVGYQAGYSGTTGVSNCYFGQGAGYTATTGQYNTYVGTSAGNLTTGSNNQFIGNGAGRSVTTGSGNSIIGNYSGNQGGLDIRTASNYIVLSDGDGNPRGIFDGSGNYSIAPTAAVVDSRINPRTVTVADTATLTPNISADDQFNITAQAQALTVAAPTGTPVDGNKLIIRILDNGTSRAITWNATYTAIGTTLPTATTINKMVYVGCIYNSTNTRWDVVAVTTQV